MDPFETEKVHPGATGLLDDWRLKLATPGATPSQPSPDASVTPEPQQFPGSDEFVMTPTQSNVRISSTLLSTC